MVRECNENSAEKKLMFYVIVSYYYLIPHLYLERERGGKRKERIVLSTNIMYFHKVPRLQEMYFNE